jgi:hypothetical protein
LPSTSWSTSWSCCFQIHIQYSFGNSIFFHPLCMSKLTQSNATLPLTLCHLMTYIRICRTAPLTSRCYILNIYSTYIRTEYFKHAA